MEDNVRLDALENIKESSKAIFEKPILYKGIKKNYGVFEIPLELLIYNKYNGRIMSRVLSYEKNIGQLNPKLEKDKEILEQFIWESSLSSNKQTLESLKRYGQNEVGIITKDGIIIDGNRRACLLNILNKELSQPRKFLAIILDDSLEDNPKEINALETIYQIGVDDKVDYNPIEKYLKIKELSRYFADFEIAELMSETKASISEYLSILALMEEYMSYFKYDGHYLVLDKREGHFVDLNNYINRYRKLINSPLSVSNWTYTESDLERLKHIYFSYIRLGYPVASCRTIGRTKKNHSFFAVDDLWNNFNLLVTESILSNSEKGISELLSEGTYIDFYKIIEYKETLWKDSVEESLDEYFEVFQFKLSTIRSDVGFKSKISYLIEQLKELENLSNSELQGFEDELKLISKINEGLIQRIKS